MNENRLKADYLLRLLGGNPIKFMNSDIMLNTRRDGLLIMESSGCVNASFTFRDVEEVDFRNCELEEIPDVAIDCEVIEKCTIGYKCCILTQFRSSQFKLDSTKISIQSKIDAIHYNHNKNAEYLVTYVETKDEKTIVSHDASRCSIVEVIRENFMNLTFLVTLNLSDNDISNLKDYVFMDLLKLEVLDLGNRN